MGITGTEGFTPHIIFVLDFYSIVPRFSVHFVPHASIFLFGFCFPHVSAEPGVTRCYAPVFRPACPSPSSSLLFSFFPESVHTPFKPTCDSSASQACLEDTAFLHIFFPKNKLIKHAHVAFSTPRLPLRSAVLSPYNAICRTPCPYYTITQLSPNCSISSDISFLASIPKTKLNKHAHVAFRTPHLPPRSAVLSPHNAICITLSPYYTITQLFDRMLHTQEPCSPIKATAPPHLRKLLEVLLRFRLMIR